MNEILSQYGVVPDGGRVKSAGFTMDQIFKHGSGFKNDPGPSSAFESARAFHVMRTNPSSDFRARFFPLEGREVKALLKDSPALYRPILKTDQGAGKFLPFRIGEESSSLPLRFDVTTEQGHVIEEAYFANQLAEAGNPGPVTRELYRLKDQFGSLILPEARMAFERLEIEAENAGLIFKREARVGRNGLMFIYPAGSEKDVIIHTEMVSRIEQQVRAKLADLFELVSVRQKEFARKNNLPERGLGETDLPFYLQADIQVLPDGRVVVAELQIPDVGLFLCELEANSEDNLGAVQEIVKPIRDRVIEGFTRLIEREGSKKSVYLVTRSEVVENEEDVLEIKELNTVKKALKQRGFRAEIITALDASRLDQDSLLFLFNLDPNTKEFEELSRAYLLKRQLQMIPSPFIKAQEREITGYEGVKLSGKDIANFQALVREVEPLEKPEKIYSQMMAVDNFLRQMGVEEDALHFFHPSIPTPIASYRYDIRSLHIALKFMNERGLDNFLLRPIPISPDRAVIFDQDGGALYATFRFMFIRS
ncbi:MAG: hypothetical protein ACD_37C00033G0004 [uncultured bacterium]|nr:MAG: hypothetical protein ACD_37C00033G0004 [uncultured bacterium]